MRLLLTCLIVLAISVGSAFSAVDEDGFHGPNLLIKNPKVQQYLATKLGTPRFVSGELVEAVPKGMELQAAISFLSDNKAAWRMIDPAVEMQEMRLDYDAVGGRHLRLQQRYENLHVIGGELVVHYNNRDQLKGVNGMYFSDLDLDPQPRFTADEASSTAKKDLLDFFGTGTQSTIELVVFPWQGTDHLAWRLFLISGTPMGRWEYLVDAHTGAVIFKANRIMNAEAIGTGIGVMGTARSHIDTYDNGSSFRMIDYTRRASNDIHGHGGQMASGSVIQTYIASSSLPGTIASDADNVWDNATTQSPAVDGHAYSALMYDWMLTQFGRNSFDDAGASMFTSVNYSAEGDNNAYWNGSQIVIWSWSSGWRSLAGCPDVIAHEWGHAVTERTSNLVYQLEPGALNESFSDMIGSAFEFAHDSLDTPDWYMGENGVVSGNGFRSASNPHEFGDPDTYGTGDPYWIDVVGCSPSWTNDWCGVHTNSGVGNKWFFLLSDGGTHNGTVVGGIGVANAMLVAYQANAFYWNSQTDYHEAALATLSAADDLDATGAWKVQTSKAWNACNVTVPGPSLAFSYPTGVPTLLQPDQTTTFEVLVAGDIGGTPVSGSGKLHYSIDGGAVSEVVMTETSTNLYDAVIPAITCGSYVEFYVSAEEQSFGQYFDPSPTDPFKAYSANSVGLLYTDSFETDLGWHVSGNATDGQWDRGVPVGGGVRGDPATDFDGSGSCFLTDNISGNSDVDGGTTILTSPIIDMSSGDGVIHYARWYSNTFGAAPGSDSFFAYISNDGGIIWTLVEQVGPTGPEASGGWFEHSFTVSDFVVPNATIRLKFEASDLGGGSVIEAAIDNLTITQYLCGASTPQIVTTSLPDWTAANGYLQQLSSIGGEGAIVWTDKLGELAGTGLSLSGSGLLSGLPVVGIVSFTALATDTLSQTDERLFSFTINAELSVVTTSLPEWTVGQAYSQQCDANGGTGSYSWADRDSNLPGTGLAISAGGLVSGSPSSSGTVVFTARVSDQVSATADRQFSVLVNALPSITTTTLPDGEQDMPYSEQLTFAGGTAPYTFTDKNNDLAAIGLTLSTGGLLSGTSTDSGVFTLTAMLQDGTGATDEVLLSLYLVPAFICGDVDGSVEDANVNDLTYMVAWLFQGGPIPSVMDAANVDGLAGPSGDVDVSDLTYLVRFLFQSGPLLNCP